MGASGAHILIHYAAAWACLLLFTQISFRSLASQAVICGYLLIHLAIDTCKSRLVAGRIVPDNGLVFLIDQCLHGVTVCIAAGMLTKSPLINLFRLLQPSPAAKFHILAVATVYVGTVSGGGYLIRYLTRGLAREITAENAKSTEKCRALHRLGGAIPDPYCDRCSGSGAGRPDPDGQIDCPLS